MSAHDTDPCVSEGAHRPAQRHPGVECPVNRNGCASCGHDVDEHGGTGPCVICPGCDSFVDPPSRPTLAGILAMPDPDGDIALFVRAMLMDDTTLNVDMPGATEELLDMVRDAMEDMSRDELSHALLAFSLCPMHECDYAICFDDNDPECAAIRAVFPSHDT